MELFEKELIFNITKAQQLGITEFPYYEYNEDGQVVYGEHKDGRWYLYEYDSNQNQTYIEESNGDWEKFIYNPRGILTGIMNCTDGEMIYSRYCG
jgi:uncharacterized protein RhaS with RHS repeats